MDNVQGPSELKGPPRDREERKERKKRKEKKRKEKKKLKKERKDKDKKEEINFSNTKPGTQHDISSKVL